MADPPKSSVFAEPAQIGAGDALRNVLAARRAERLKQQQDMCIVRKREEAVMEAEEHAQAVAAEEERKRQEAEAVAAAARAEELRRDQEEARVQAVREKQQQAIRQAEAEAREAEEAREREKEQALALIRAKEEAANTERQRQREEAARLDQEDNEALRAFRELREQAKNVDLKSCGSSGCDSGSNNPIADGSDPSSKSKRELAELVDDEILEIVDVEEDTGIVFGNPSKFAWGASVDLGFGSIFGSNSGPSSSCRITQGEADQEASAKEKTNKKEKKKAKRQKKQQQQRLEEDETDSAMLAISAHLQDTREKVLLRLQENTQRKKFRQDHDAQLGAVD